MLPVSGGLGTDTALAAIPARFAFERGGWEDAAQLTVRSSQFPAAQSISYFARALGAARSGDMATARSEIAHLDEIEAKLAAAKDDYWAGQTRIQKAERSGDGLGHVLRWPARGSHCRDAQGRRSR